MKLIWQICGKERWSCNFLKLGILQISRWKYLFPSAMVKCFFPLQRTKAWRSRWKSENRRIKNDDDCTAPTKNKYPLYLRDFVNNQLVLVSANCLFLDLALFCEILLEQPQLHCLPITFFRAIVYALRIQYCLYFNPSKLTNILTVRMIYLRCLLLFGWFNVISSVRYWSSTYCCSFIICRRSMYYEQTERLLHNHRCRFYFNRG